MTERHDDPQRMTDEEFFDELDKSMQEYFALERAAEIELIKASEQTIKASLAVVDHFSKLLWK
jgi:hypothetical protein